MTTTKTTPTTEVPEESLKEWYSLVPDPDNADADYWCIRLDKGEYTGLVYKYGEIGVSPKLNEDGTLPVNFEYDILFVPEDLRKKEFMDEKKQEFENFLGSIMMQMIQEDLDIKSMGDDSSTDVDSEKKFVVRRRISTEGSAFSK
jgi:hypothetical protein